MTAELLTRPARSQQNSEDNYMSLAKTIAPILPPLRRYARALTGSQRSGDAVVSATLEAIIANEGLLDGLEPKVGLYKAFHGIWASSLVEPHAEVSRQGSPREQKAAERLQTLTPLSRQALLLNALEGFSPSDAATILGVSRDEVTDLIDEASQAIQKETAARVLIIEDEAVIAMDLEDIVTALGHTVVGAAATAKTAIAVAGRERPELVLADIQLADGSSGVDAVKAILAQFSVPVIFITAFPDRLLTGERPEPTFLITKPYSPDVVRAAISQALFFESSEHISV